MNGYKIIWKETEIGYFMKAIPDMWYLDGFYDPNTSDLSKQFTEMASKLEPKSIMTDWTKGIRAKLKVNDDEPINIIVISLDKNNGLFVRQVENEDGIKWLYENVPEEK